MRLNGLKQYGKELANIVRNKKVLIPLVAILTVPVMYTAMFLGAFWDPYDRLEELPVAVVNSDEGTEFQGEQMHIGKNFEEQLKENRKFNWSFVSMEEAMDGLQSNKYYMAIEIPADFSAKTTSLTSDKPEAAKLVYLPNESFNFLASQIGNTAVEQMKGMLNKEVTEAYARTVFEKLEQAADGIVQASDGAGQLVNGTSKAKDGALLLQENMSKLAGGAVELKNGAAKLDEAGGKLAKGTSELSKGTAELAAGLGQLADASGALNGAAASAQEGASKLAAGLASAAEGSAQLEAGAGQLAAGLEQMAAANPELAASEQFQSLLKAGKGLSEGLATALAGQTELAQGASSLEQGLNKLGAGANTLEAKLKEAHGGAASLAAGAGKLDEGAGELAAGLGKLNDSVGSLTSGSRELANGASQIASGLLELDSGSRELSDKLSDASKQTAELNLTDEMTDMFADPVHLDVERIHEVPNYGTGFAPYFLSLGLYVGALLLTIVYTVREPAAMPANGWSWFWSKALTMMTVGVVQALIADAALLWLLKLEVQNLPLFVLFSILTSVTFMMLIQFFVTTMGNPGRFVAIVLLILQLTSSAGTFPLELIPEWMQHVTPWLPMTYSVAGLKDVISSGDSAAMWTQAGALGIFAAVFAALTLAYFIASHRRGNAGAGMEAAAEA